MGCRAMPTLFNLCDDRYMCADRCQHHDATTSNV
jgi:hypothetical protein